MEAIALEKSAIFRAHRPALTSARGAGLHALQTAYPEELTITEPLDSQYPLGLLGSHQRDNAGLAVSIAHHYGVTADYGALAGVHWPGRCEVIDGVLLDCAHNPDGIHALSAVSHIQRASQVHVIFGVMEGKDVLSMAQSIERWADVVTVVTPDYPRRIPAADVAQSFRNATSRPRSSPQSTKR